MRLIEGGFLSAFKLTRFIVGGKWRYYHFGEGLPPARLFAIWTQDLNIIPKEWVFLSKETYLTWPVRRYKFKKFFRIKTKEIL